MREAPMKEVEVPLRQKANEWIEKNPLVYHLFEKYALMLADRGRQFGINLIRERVRWDEHYEYEEGKFKFQNSFSPYIARRLVQDHPRLLNHMRFRKCKDEV
jgi:hypothetical protein